VADAPVIPIICGPTGAGKTSVAVALAQEIPIEIVSADSRQLIRRLDIGTAKPTAEERAAAVFHLVDVIEPGERYSAFRFMEEANEAIAGILTRGRVPLVVGGTGLYLRALSEGVVEIEEEDMAVRRRLEEEIAGGGAQRLYEKLKEIDPVEAARVHPNNEVRLVRALEIFYVTGKTKSELIASGGMTPKYSFAYYCLTPERVVLYDRINIRVDAMMAHGLLSEVQGLVSAGLAEPVRRSNVIGYNEMLDYLEEKRTLDQAVSLIKQNHRRYAKRQMTWFRHQIDGKFFPDGDSLREAIEQRPGDLGRPRGL
jgi:tRNA dimethylallyltransferase